MEIKIISKKSNPLLWREEIEGKVIFKEGTPRKEELIGLLAKELGVDKELISIKTKQKFGIKEIDIFAKVYTSKEKMAQVEGKKIKKAEEKKAAEIAEKIEEKKEERKAEKSEEKKEEKKEKS